MKEIIGIIGEAFLFIGLAIPSIWILKIFIEIIFTREAPKEMKFMSFCMLMIVLGCGFMAISESIKG